MKNSIIKYYLNSQLNLAHFFSRLEVNCCVCSKNCSWWTEGKASLLQSRAFADMFAPDRAREDVRAPESKLTCCLPLVVVRQGSAEDACSYWVSPGLGLIGHHTCNIFFSTLIINSFPSFSGYPMDWELNQLAISRSLDLRTWPWEIWPNVYLTRG